MALERELSRLKAQDLDNNTFSFSYFYDRRIASSILSVYYSDFVPVYQTFHEQILLRGQEYLGCLGASTSASQTS